VAGCLLDDKEVGDAVEDDRTLPALLFERFHHEQLIRVEAREVGQHLGHREPPIAVVR